MDNSLNYNIQDIEELKELSSSMDGKGINIDIDFTCFKCDCGNVVLFEDSTCKNCGQIMEKEWENDPKVKQRCEKLSEVLLMIRNSDVKIKNLRKALNRGEMVKDYNDDFISFAQIVFDKINVLIDKEIFNNISFRSDVLDSADTQNTIIDLKQYISEVYDLFEELLKAGFPDFWENAYARLTKSIQSFLGCNKTLIESITCETAKDAIKVMNSAQINIDIATEEIYFLSNIFNIKNMDFNFDLFSKGEVNMSFVMAMILSGGNFSDVSTSMHDLQNGIYKYFKSLLTNSFENYLQDSTILMRLAPYKLMGMIAFSEMKFFRKIRVVTTLLEKAYKSNSTEFNDFLGKFLNKYVYALNKLQELSEEFAFVFSHSPKKKILIKNALRWYKDLSEGVYKDITSILIASAYIIDGKDIDYDSILRGMGFPDKMNYLENKKEHRLEILIDGVVKTIRHSEAHVDYDIVDTEEKIVVRNVKVDKHSKNISVEDAIYTYEEFLNIETTLAETIYAIVAGLNIFFANNHKDFESFLSDAENLIGTNKFNIVEIMLPFIGIIVESMAEVFEEGKNILDIRGISIERNDRELLNKVISCVCPIVQQRPEIDLIRVDIRDSDNIIIGSVEVITKYVKSYNIAKKEFQKFDTLLLLMTTKCEYVFDEDYKESIDKLGFKFIFAIFKFVMVLIEQLKYLKIKLLKDIKENEPELKQISEEFGYAFNTIIEYIPFVSDNRLLEYVSNIIKNFVTETDDLINCYDKNQLLAINKAYLAYTRNCFQIANTFATEGDHEKINELLNNKQLLIDSTRTVEKPGRNDPCTCKSGKKYKKCCGK